MPAVRQCVIFEQFVARSSLHPFSLTYVPVRSAKFGPHDGEKVGARVGGLVSPTLVGAGVGTRVGAAHTIKRAQCECKECDPSSSRSARRRVRFCAIGTRPWSTLRVPGEHRKPSPPPCDAARPPKSTRRGAAHTRCTACRSPTTRRRCTADRPIHCVSTLCPASTRRHPARTLRGAPHNAVHCPLRPTQTATTTRRSLACSAGGRSTVGAPYKRFKGEVYLSFTLLGTVEVPCEYPSVAAYARVRTSGAQQPPAGAAGEGTHCVSTL